MTNFFNESIENLARLLTITVSHLVEMVSAVIIGLALVNLLYGFLLSYKKGVVSPNKERLRLQFGSSVGVSLELLLGADVLATAVAPSWNDIGQLAAIAIIRTVLNYFLERELTHAPDAKRNPQLVKSPGDAGITH